MSDNALYVYGIVEFGFDIDWKENGLNGKNVYAINQGKHSALVHDCEEKPYTSEDPNKIKELIISHNHILDKAMEDFGGVIPLHFNTVIKKTENSARDNLKKWLSNEEERLKKAWNKINARREYGIRIYYDKDGLVQEISSNAEMKEAEESLQEKSDGLKYLLQSKAKSKINEIVQGKIVSFKRKFYNDINKITPNVLLNSSRILIDEKKDLLLSLSILVDKQQIDKIIRFLDKKTYKNFSYQLAGPFAPYSFVES